MPLSRHSWASVSRMAREASATSLVPSQNRAKPSPVPGPSTVKPKFGLSALKSSETACETGSTVEEPETKISPLTPWPLGTDDGLLDAPLVGVGVAGLPHAATRAVVAIARAAIVLPLITWMTLLSETRACLLRVRVWNPRVNVSLAPG